MNKIFVFLLAIISYSCIKKSEETRPFQAMDITVNKNDWSRRTSNLTPKQIRIETEDNLNIKTSELFISVRYVPLETRNDIVIGEVDKIVTTDNKIFLMDSKKAKAVYAFDKNGKFLNKIGNSGIGPGEYYFPQDMEVDEDNKEVFIFNGNQKKIFHYSFNGEYKGVTKLPVYCYGFAIDSLKNFILYAGNYPNRHLGSLSGKFLYKINQAGNIIGLSEDFPNHLKGQTIFGVDKNLSGENGLLSVCNIFSDTIYSITQHAIVPQFFINYGGNALDADYVGSHATDEIWKTKKFHYLGTHLQSNNFLIFNYTKFFDGKGRREVTCIFNKESLELKQFEISTRDDGIVGIIRMMELHGDMVTGYFFPSEVLMALEKADKNGWDLPEELIELDIMKKIRSMEMTDNPIIVFYKLK